MRKTDDSIQVTSNTRTITPTTTIRNYRDLPFYHQISVPFGLVERLDLELGIAR